MNHYSKSVKVEEPIGETEILSASVSTGDLPGRVDLPEVEDTLRMTRRIGEAETTRLRD